MTPAALLLSVLALGADPTPEPLAKRADYQSCGLNSFYTICRLLDVPVSLGESRQLLGPPGSDDGHSFDDLTRAGRAVGLHPLALRTDLARLRQLPMPAIVHVIDGRQAAPQFHLLVILRVDEDRVVLLDPPMPAYYLPNDDFAKVWTGNVLLFPSDQAAVDELTVGAWHTRLSQVVLPVGGGVAVVALLLAGVGLVRRDRFVAGWNRTPRWVKGGVGVFLLLLAGAGIIAFVATRPPANARCEFVNLETELGELDPGTHVVEIKLKNTGDIPLEVTAVQSSCTCASVTAPPSIPPGGTGVLRADLNIGRGPQRTTFVVKSNDPSGDKTIRLLWSGRSRPILHPWNVDVDDAPSDRPSEQVVRLIFPSGDRALRPQLVGVECDTPGVAVTQGETRMASTEEFIGRRFGETDLRVTVQPPTNGLPIRTTAKLSIKHGDQTFHLSVPVTVHFRRPDLVPDSRGVLFAGEDRRALVGAERTVRVAGTAPKLDFPDLPTWLAVDQHREANVIILRIRLTAVGDTSGHAIIHLRDGRGPDVPIAVHVLAARNSVDR